MFSRIGNTWNRMGMLFAKGALLAIALSAPGCIYVEANDPPFISDALVETDFDDYYGECFWDFYAWVDDPDGEYDVTGVYVDVEDLVSGEVAGQFYLAWDGYGQWSNRIYETYAGYADCYYPDDFGFTFYAFDEHGDYDFLSF